MSFTIADFKEIVTTLDSQRFKEYSIPMSFEQRFRFELYVEMTTLDLKFRYFETTSTPRNKTNQYIEITPFSKGGLYKIRCFFSKKYDLYYGTRKICYCSDFRSAMGEINRLTNKQ